MQKASFQDRIQELEEKLAMVQVEHQKAIKEKTEKLQHECKTQLETIRSRFKLMAASTMERSPSDSSLEKIERIDMIEIVNHETILEQMKKDMEIEKENAIRLAVKQECEALIRDLKIAKVLLKEGEEASNAYVHQKAAFIKERQHYKCKIQELNEELDHKFSAEHEKIQQQEKHIRLLEVERDELRRELNEERLKMTQSNIELSETLTSLEEPDKDEVQVSESKKVRLEADSSLVSFPGRFEILEADNKRLSSELRISRENKELFEAKVEALEKERSRLEVELVQERSKRNFAADSLSLSTLATTSDNIHDKGISASISLASDVSPTARVDAATSTEIHRREKFCLTESMLGTLNKKLCDFRYLSQVTFMSCNDNDIVLIIWDQIHRNYIILQNTPTLFFLNPDCFNNLDLKLNEEGLPTKVLAIAKVIDKEYCSARKSENRYKVPQGTKFYRVRVKPVNIK